MKIITNILAFLGTRVGIVVIGVLLAATAVQFKDSIPFLAATCKVWEPCKVQYDNMTVTMTPVPITTDRPVVVTSDTTTGDLSVKVALPVNTSATTQ